MKNSGSHLLRWCFRYLERLVVRTGIVPLPEGLFWPNDAKALPRHWQDPSSPMRRYEMDSTFLPARNSAIFRRHGLHPSFVSLSDAGFALLKADLSSSAFATAATLAPAEFLGFTCGLWLNGKESDNADLSLPWRRELTLVFFKIERARRSRNAEREAALRRLYRELREKYAAEIEINKAIVLREVATIH